MFVMRSRPVIFAVAVRIMGNHTGLPLRPKSDIFRFYVGIVSHKWSDVKDYFYISILEKRVIEIISKACGFF